MSSILGNVDDGLGGTVSPDADDGQGKSQGREGGPGDIAPSQALDAGANFLAVDILNLLLACGLAVGIAEDLVARLHSGTRRGLGCGRRGDGSGSWLGHEARGDGGEGDEDRGIEEVGMAGGARGENEAEEEGRRGERGEGEDGRLEGLGEGGEAVRGGC